MKINDGIIQKANIIEIIIYQQLKKIRTNIDIKMVEKNDIGMMNLYL